MKMCIAKEDFIRSNQVMRELFKLNHDKYDMVVQITQLYSQKSQYTLALEALQKFLAMDASLTLQQVTHLTGL